MILPTRTCPPTRTAPVLPADTNASHVPSLTIFIPFTIEESFLERIAATGGSAVSITSVAFTISTCSCGNVYFASSVRMTSSLPTRNTLIFLLSITASAAPFITSVGALSPPIASTATLIHSFIARFLHLKLRLI